jgi:hypothetical protein
MHFSATEIPAFCVYLNDAACSLELAPSNPAALRPRSAEAAGRVHFCRRFEMTRNGKIALAVAAVALTIGAAGAIAKRHNHWGHGHHGHHMGMGFGGPLAAVCRGDASEMADHMLVRVEHRVKPTDAQKLVFEELKTTVKSAAGKVAAACPPEPSPAADGKPVRKAPTERLADTEAGLTAALDAVRMVRPVADKFYASLTEEQKTTLSEMGPRGKRGRDEWHGGDRRDTERDAQ